MRPRFFFQGFLETSTRINPSLLQKIKGLGPQAESQSHPVQPDARFYYACTSTNQSLAVALYFLSCFVSHSHSPQSWMPLYCPIVCRCFLNGTYPVRCQVTFLNSSFGCDLFSYWFRYDYPSRLHYKLAYGSSIVIKLNMHLISLPSIATQNF